MRSAKDFINRVVRKMGYNPDQFTVVEGGNDFDRISDEITFGLDGGMVFVLDSLIPTEANECVREWSLLDNRKVISCDVDNGVSIIVKGEKGEEGINVQPLGVINAFLNQLIKIESQEATNDFVEETETERISLKDYYRLNLPDNKIGRKSDKTLIKELEEAGFKV